MVKLRPSQKPNPLTDYDKTLHNWLRPRGERVTQNLCESAVSERLAKYVKGFFLFFPRLAYWSDPWMDFDAHTIYSILGIAAAVYFPVIKHYIRYHKFSFGNVYTAFVDNLFTGCPIKRSHRAVLLENFRNFDTQAADIRRTFRLSTKMN